MWASWLKKLVELSLWCTVHTLSNATQQESTTTVCAIKFNELAWCSVSHPNALPLAFLCCLCVCMRFGALAKCPQHTVGVFEMSTRLSWKFLPKSFLKITGSRWCNGFSLVACFLTQFYNSYCYTSSFSSPKMRAVVDITCESIMSPDIWNTAVCRHANCARLIVALWLLCYAMLAPPKLHLKHNQRDAPPQMFVFHLV